MKICLVNNLYYPGKRGGAEEMVHLLANELKNQKHKVFIICSSSDYKKTTTEKINGVDVYRIGYEKYFPFSEISKQNILKRFLWRINQLKNKYSASIVYSILTKEKPSLVLSHNTLALGYNIIKTINNYCEIKKIKHITTIHDVQLIYPSGILKLDNTKRGLLLKIYSFFTKNIYSSCRNIIFPSNALSKIYTNNKFFRKGNIFTINNPIKVGSHAIEKTNSDKLRILYLGQLEEHKGVMDLIKTIRQLDPEKFHLTIAGRGSLVDKINKSTYIVNNVDYVGGFDEEKRIKLLKDADLVVVPSTCFENSPMIIYEAFLSGTPVLASNIGGIPELVLNNETGWLFKPGNTKDLKAKLLEIYEKKDNLDDIQKNCFEFVKQFDIKNYIKKILEIH